MMQRLSEGKLPTKSSVVSYVPPMQTVLSCFYGGDEKAKRPPPQKSPAADNPEEAEQENQIEVDPELVAEPIAARSKSFVGTQKYLALEVISAGGNASTVDWWVLGVFLYEMTHGRTSFKGVDNEKTLVNILKQPLTFPLTSSPTYPNKNTDDEAKARDLIAKLLVPDLGG